MSEHAILNAAMVPFHADDVIVQEGQQYDHMFKIISGSVAVYTHFGQSEEHLIGIYSRPRCFGELHVLSDQPSIYTVVAYDEVLLLRIPKDSLEDFVRNNPQNAIDIMKNMTHTVTVMQKNIDLLLDDLYDKHHISHTATEEIKKKLIQYGIRGIYHGP